MDETAVDLAPVTREDFVPREPRYEVCRSREATVVVQRMTGGEHKPIDAKLIDISPGGGKLLVNACIPFDETLRVKINVAELNDEIVVEASVRWTRPADEDKCLLGCAFTPKIPVDALNQLASGGYIERRRHKRFPINVRATTSWELCETSVPVLLQDASDGGFSMTSPRQVETGQRFILQLNVPDQEPKAIPATVQWHTKRGNEYLIGCAFVKERSFENLFLLAPAKGEAGRAIPAASMSWRSFAAVATTTMLVTSAYLWFSNSADSPQPFRHRDAISAGNDSRSIAGHVASRIETSVAGDANESNILESIAATRPLSTDLPRTASSLIDRLSPHEDVPSNSSDAAQARPIGDRSPRHNPPSQQHATDDARPAAIDSIIDEDRTLASDDQVPDTPQSPHDPPPPLVQSDEPTTEPVEPPPVVRSTELPQRPLNVSLLDEPATPPVEPEPQVTDRKPKSIEPTPSAEIVHSEPTPPTPPIEDPRRAATLVHRAGEHYHRGDFAAAVVMFQQASSLDNTSAQYVYLTALAEYQLGRIDDARRSVAHATVLEHNHPVKNWGPTMRRYQGRARVWLEQSRSAARDAN